MAKLWIDNKLYSVENEVQDYCDKQDERIELFKSRVEQLEYTEICEDCSAKTKLPQKLIGCKAKERIKELEDALDLCGRLRQDDHKKAIKELVTTRQYLTGRIKELEAVIQAALRISDLWTLKEVETMFEDEAKALELMKQGFERVLKG